MTDDKLKEVLQLFAASLMAIGRAITYDEQNKSQAINRVIESDKYLSEIIEIVTKP